MKRRKIGIVGNMSENNFSIGCNYIRWINQSLKMTPVLIDPTETEVQEIDLLVLPGGSDVNPARYGGVLDLSVGLPNRALEGFDHWVLPKYINSGIPIFGICRGLQTLNVVFGGSLKNVDEEPTSSFDGAPVHAFKCLKTGDFFECSSNHHQAIDRLADGFEVLGVGFEIERDPKNRKNVLIKDELNIEAFRHKELPIAGFQFHPEKNYVSNSCTKSMHYANEVLFSLLSK